MKKRINITENISLNLPFSTDVHFYLWATLKHIKYTSFILSEEIYYENN